VACRRIKGFKRGDKTPPSPTNRKNLRRRRISMNFDELWTNKDEEATLKFEEKDGSDVPLHVEAPDLAEKEMPNNWIGFTEGVLLKQGTGWFGKKKERYFRFRNQYITIYKTKDAEHPHASFNVERITSIQTGEKRKEIKIAFEKPASERELFVKHEEEAVKWKQAIESRQRWLKDRRKQQRERLKLHGLRMTRFAGHVRAVGHLKAKARGARERLKKRKEEYERRKREEERKRKEEERKRKEEEERLKREREAEEERKRKEREEAERKRLKEKPESQQMMEMRQELLKLKKQGADEDALKKAEEEKKKRQEEEMKRQMELAEERNRIVRCCCVVRVSYL